MADERIPTVCDCATDEPFSAPSLQLVPLLDLLPKLVYNSQVAIPLDRIGDCLDALTGAMNDPRKLLRDGLPIPALVRFIKSEPFYLSPTHVRVALNAYR